MSIRTGNTFIADNSDYYVIDASGAEGNPIRGIYHSDNAWNEIPFGTINVPTYLEDGAVTYPHMVANSIISVPFIDGSPKRTFYQSLVNASSTPDNQSGTTLNNVSVSDMTYNWQMRKHFHEFAMQFDKYPAIDQVHFAQYPEEYLFCVWRQDKKQFQTLKVGQLGAGIIGDGQNELIDNGVFTEFDFNPSNDDYYPGDANPTDLNGDGVTSTADLIQFLVNFGNVNDPNSSLNANQESSVIRIVYPDSDDDNPPFDVVRHVSGNSDGTSNLTASSVIDLSEWLPQNEDGQGGGNPNYVYGPGHPLTIPVDAFTLIPEFGDLTIDTTDSFGQGNIAINRPNTDNYDGLDFDQWDGVDNFVISAIHKAGNFTNLNKFVILKARVTVNTPIPDILHMHSYGRFTRGIYSYPIKSCTRGEGGFTETVGTGFSQITPERVNINGEPAPDNHRSWLITPSQTGDTRWVSIVMGLPSMDFTGTGPQQQILTWDYQTPAPILYDPDSDVYSTSPRALLRMTSGEFEVDDVKMSFGFFSEFGFIDDVKVHEVKIILAPSIQGQVYND